MAVGQNLNTSTINVGGLDIRYFFGGHGDPLVVVHGGGGGADTWLKNAMLLSKRYSVYVPDLPGFGQSQAMEGGFEFARYAQFIEDFAARIGLKRFSLLGHSLGGGIAAAYAIGHPHRVKKLVLVDSLGLGKEITVFARLACWMLGGVGRVILKGIRRLVRLFYAEVKSLRAISGFNLEMGSSLMGLGGQSINFLDGLSRLLVPTLLIWGARDAVVPVVHAYAAMQLIPNCKLKVFNDCGHSVYRQKLKEFCQVLAGFLG